MPLPTTLAELQARIAEQASDPLVAINLWFEAVYVYIHVDRDVGSAMITEMTKDKRWDRPGCAFVERLNSQPYIFASYAAGATPGNDYAMDPQQFELTFGRVDTKPYPDRDEGENVKVWLDCGGADNPRPIEMQRNNQGHYKAANFSSIYVGARPPKSVQDEKADF